MLTPESGKLNITDDGQVCSYYCKAPKEPTYCKKDRDCRALGSDYCCADIT